MVKVRFCLHDGEVYESRFISKDALVSYMNTQKYIEVVEDVFIMREEIYKFTIIERELNEHE